MNRAACARGVTVRFELRREGSVFYMVPEDSVPQRARELLTTAVAPESWEFRYGPRLKTFFLHFAPLGKPADKLAP